MAVQYLCCTLLHTLTIATIGPFIAFWFRHWLNWVCTTWSVNMRRSWRSLLDASKTWCPILGNGLGRAVHGRWGKHDPAWTDSAYEPQSSGVRCLEGPAWGVNHWLLVTLRLNYEQKAGSASSPERTQTSGRSSEVLNFSISLKYTHSPWGYEFVCNPFLPVFSSNTCM